jgi:hypothetical protein
VVGAAVVVVVGAAVVVVVVAIPPPLIAAINPSTVALLYNFSAGWLRPLGYIRINEFICTPFATTVVG